MRLGERGGLGGVDSQIHSPLVQRGDLLGGDEPAASARANHDPVEDVLLGSGDDVVDGSYGLSAGPVHGNALLEHLVGDRKAFVHRSNGTGTYVSTRSTACPASSWPLPSGAFSMSLMLVPPTNCGSRRRGGEPCWGRSPALRMSCLSLSKNLMVTAYPQQRGLERTVARLQRPGGG